MQIKDITTKSLIILLIFNLFSVLTGCNEIKKSSDKNLTDIITVNPFNKEKIKLSTFAKAIRYIPLETIKGHYLANINKIFFINNRFYIIDSNKKHSIFCFDKDGKFIFEIAKQGKGPGEFIFLSDAEISYDNKSIVVVDQDQKKYIFYDLNGKFIKEQRISANLFFVNFCLHKDYNILLAQSMLLNDANDAFSNKEKITQEYANEHFKNYNYMSSASDFTETYQGFKLCNLLAENIILAKPFDLYNDQIYSTYAYNDTIFVFDKTSCTPKFYVDFGANKIPSKLTKDEANRTYHELYHNKTLKWAGILDHLVINKKFIAFSYGTAFNIDNSSLYLTSDKQTINFDQIDNDINNGPLGNIVGKYSDDTMISCIEAYDFIKETNKTYNDDKILSLGYSINENSNPVIILTAIK
jgi:hypothetical protein